MFPKAFKIINGTEYFIYDRKELEMWKAYGYKHGSTGMLPFSRNPLTKVIRYKGFGTIENPHKTMMDMSLIHHKLFDGDWLPPEKIVKSFEQEKRDNDEYWKRHSADHRFVILDFSGDGETNLQYAKSKYPLTPDECYEIKKDTDTTH